MLERFGIGRSICPEIAIESKYLKHNEIGEGFWIEKFEAFITNYLNSELNNFEE